MAVLRKKCESRNEREWHVAQNCNVYTSSRGHNHLLQLQVDHTKTI